MSNATTQLLKDYVRVTRRQRCPVCESPDWCLLARDGSTAICARMISSDQRGDAGYMHELDKPVEPIRVNEARRFVERNITPANWNFIAVEAKQRITVNELRDFAHSLGVTSTSLWRLETGRTLQGDFTNPMRNADESIIGIRLRKPDGFKYAITGSQNGLFIPRGLTDAGPLFIVEGASDVAALLDMDINAIGRPSCSSCVDMTVQFVTNAENREWCVVEDHDEPKKRPDGSVWHPGQEGARKLAEALRATGKPGKLIAPIGAKDTREWKRNGATRQTIVKVYANARYFSPATPATPK